MCWNTYFIVFFEHQPKIAKKWQKNDNFWHFAKHRLIKNTVLLQPPCWPKVLFFELFVLKPKTLMLNKKHNLKSGNSKDKKRNLKQKKTGNQKKREYWWRKNLQFNILMLFLSWKKSKGERKIKKDTKTRNQKKAKKQRQEGIKKEKKKKERQRKRNRKRGRPKEAKRERKRNTETKNALF